MRKFILWSVLIFSCISLTNNAYAHKSYRQHGSSFSFSYNHGSYKHYPRQTHSYRYYQPKRYYQPRHYQPKRYYYNDDNYCPSTGFSYRPIRGHECSRHYDHWHCY